ncbi:formate dehydrogenase subunit gamma [Oceaniglobus ichthyenteri]|uniref:formate dehydrogenase subunit gamma n=1 Tax=Oceaniglobus ichthyenteri TaxID=2136177 RepID=UPI000D3D55A7|nr:formate dehydrogenase subunit gamma [Oceaniglobus ichthyenteri]
MNILRTVLCTLSIILMAGLVQAQEIPDRSSTGGAPTLADIMARQAQQKVDDSARRANTGNPDAGLPITEQLGTRGGASDPELWRALRFNTADVTTQNNGPAAEVLIQDRGMWWLKQRGPLMTYGFFILLGTLIALILFYLIRGRIPIEGEKTGRRIERFKAAERFGHWLLAGSFILLALSGTITLFGRKFIIPVIGHDAFSTVALACKLIHNNVSWAFMLALVIIFVFWVAHNLPDKTDINWLLKGGGIFGGGHPPAKKFNAGQKVIFWSVILLGTSISVTGLSLLFPFEMPMFAATFETINAWGIPGWFNQAPLNTALTPHEEMQYAQLWHSIVSIVLATIVLAHIYIGSVGMEGAYAAMGSGDVEEQWAREHHSIWVDEVKARENKGAKT